MKITSKIHHLQKFSFKLKFSRRHYYLSQIAIRKHQKLNENKIKINEPFRPNFENIIGPITGVINIIHKKKCRICGKTCWLVLRVYALVSQDCNFCAANFPDICVRETEREKNWDGPSKGRPASLSGHKD